MACLAARDSPIRLPGRVNLALFPRSWKTMENKKKSRPGKVMENENLAKSHGKVMEF